MVSSLAAMTKFPNIVLLAFYLVSYVLAAKDLDKKPEIPKIGGYLYLYELTGDHGHHGMHEGGHFASTSFNYSLDQCVSDGHCPPTMSTYKGLWDRIYSLKPKLLTDTISGISTTFNETTHGRHRLSSDEVSSFIGYLSYDVEIRRNKYMAMLVVYLIVTIVFFVLNRLRNLLAIDYEFKLSRLSKLMLKYLVIKSVFNLVFLVLMFTYVDDGIIKKRLGYFYLTFESYIQGPITFALAVLFASGYATKRYKIDAPLAWRVIILTACDIILTAPNVLREEKSWTFLTAVWLETPLAIMYCILIGYCFYLGFKSYQIDGDHRFLQSAKAIVIGIVMVPFVVVPEDFWTIKYLFVDTVVRAKFTFAAGMHIPELIEFAVIVYLIYVWRFIHDEEQKYIELESLQTYQDGEGI